MPSQKSVRAMKEIWDTTSIPAPDGNRYLLLKNEDDLIYIYACGFVDEGKFRWEEWVDSFVDSLMQNGAYMVSEVQWMDKVRFRYEGEIGKPFDPYLVREGDWPEEEFWKLFREKVLPSVYFTEEELKKIFDMGKGNGFFKNGKFRMSQELKADLLHLLNTYPSPQRVREMRLSEAWARKLKGSPLPMPGRAASATPGGVFFSGKTPSEQAAQKLTEILSKGGGKKLESS